MEIEKIHRSPAATDAALISNREIAKQNWSSPMLTTLRVTSTNGGITGVNETNVGTGKAFS
ncbi:MAG: hypothetical protein EBX40_03295 [Gammaproteobacteria bacterium]|nr:hypothetical protein [Gammaproteobacteria bacterium]